METEKRLTQYLTDTKYGDLPQESVDVNKKMILAIAGTTIAGTAEEGCEALIGQVREWAGKEEDMAYKDLRAFISRLEGLGEPHRVKAEVDWNLELSHVAKINERESILFWWHWSLSPSCSSSFLRSQRFCRQYFTNKPGRKTQ